MRLVPLRLAVAALLVVPAFACKQDDALRRGTASGVDGAASKPTSPGGNGNGAAGDDTKDLSTPDESITLTDEMMDFAGKTRSYALAKPKSYDPATSYPLVMAFHGNPGDAKAMAKGVAFSTVSRARAIVVYPQGWGSNWDLYTPTETNNDMRFVEALVDQIKSSKANIDKNRVFGFGFSGGAFFITQMACRFAGFFKAISVNAGGGPDEDQIGFQKREDGCYTCPGGPIPTLVTHGSADLEVKPSSGAFTATCYAATNGCAESLSATTPAPCQAYDACPAERPVKWCLIPGLRHGLWSEAMEASWGFFSSL